MNNKHLKRQQEKYLDRAEDAEKGYGSGPARERAAEEAKKIREDMAHERQHRERK